MPLSADRSERSKEKEDMHRIVRAEQTRLLYGNILATIAANSALGLSLVAIQAPAVAPAIRMGWLAVLAFDMALWLAMGLLWFYRDGGKQPDDDPRWLRIYRLVNGFNGVIWGIGGVLLFPPGDLPHQMLLALAYVGLGAGAVTSLAIDAVASTSFVLPATIPQVICLALEGGEIPLTVVFMSGIFIPFIVASGIRTGRRLRENVTLRAEATMREAELIKAKEQAEQANLAKSLFLASINHELRTPLHSIVGFASLLKGKTDLPAETVSKHASEIGQAAKHLLTMVDNLIDLARIDAEQMKFFCEPLSLQEVVEDSLAMMAPLADGKDITLVDEVRASSEVVIHADYNRLRQVMINFLSNAIKYNKPNGQVRIRYRLNDGAVRICVVDTGEGIPQELQQRLFNPFDRLGKERGRIEGTGIGLVITKKLVEAMDGTVGFESIEGQGSTFWAEFAAADSRSSP